jgi:ArsR family transcriptional regulator
MPSLDDSAGLLGLLADPTRMRLLSLLEREELTVAELVSITGLSQSRVSTHLGRLRDAGMLRVRPSGASAYYALNASMPEEARGLWQVIRDRLSDSVVESDGRQCGAVVKARVAEGGWVDAVAGEMERHYSPGRTWEALAHGMIGFARLGDVLDVGAGDGFVAGLVAARARSVTCFDRSERMIDAARARLAGSDNVRFVAGDMHALPFPAESFDEVALFNVLTYSEDPGRVLSEAARVLRPGGAITVLTLNAHAHESVTAPYGHLQPGFRPASLRRWLARAGVDVARCAIVGRERRAPHFELLAAFATKPMNRTDADPALLHDHDPARPPPP